METSEMPQRPKDTFGRMVFKQVTGTGVGCAIGASGFAGAVKLDLWKARKLCGNNPKNGAFVGAGMMAVASLGAGEAIYDLTIGQLEHKPSFADKIAKEKTNALQATKCMTL